MKLSRREPDLDIPLIYGVITLVLTAVVYTARSLHLPLPGCILYDSTGIACPTCGGTRALWHLSRLHLVESFLANPMVCLLALAAVILGAHGLIRRCLGKPQIVLDTSVQERRWFAIGIVTMAGLSWLYLLAK